jgi:hypothetical protein
MDLCEGSHEGYVPRATITLHLLNSKSANVVALCAACLPDAMANLMHERQDFEVGSAHARVVVKFQAEIGAKNG